MIIGISICISIYGSCVCCLYVYTGCCLIIGVVVVSNKNISSVLNQNRIKGDITAPPRAEIAKSHLPHLSKTYNLPHTTHFSHSCSK